MADKVIRRSIALETIDVAAINEVAKEKGLGARGFSAALRMIIREWIKFRRDDGHEKEDQFKS